MLRGEEKREEDLLTSLILIKRFSVERMDIVIHVLVRL